MELVSVRSAAHMCVQPTSTLIDWDDLFILPLTRESPGPGAQDYPIALLHDVS